MPGPRYSTQKCMGRVLIVQNQKYVGIRHTRGDKEEDNKVEEMKTTLGKMGFTDACIEVHKNKTKAEMIRLLEDVAKRTDLKDDYCFICMVLSYGKDGVIICCDETHSPANPTPSMQLPVSELQECLKGDKCRDLLLKPKIFMLQLEAVPYSSPQSAANLPSDTHTEKPVKIPREADFLIYTCVRDYALTAWIEGFKQYVLKPEQSEQHGQPKQPMEPMEIQKLLTRMNHLYCKPYIDAGSYVDIPCVTSLLTREAYLKLEEPSPK
ncbi:caspase-7-like isoform X2 [Crassostrea angulata]|uniref:caspase-7 isoform X1 n=1 Tax=Magallana gigas TaxID=29159 RepID=UPI0022B161ED|nr:caspase-7-like isoform X2 [Crassostrea angulata]